MSSNNTRSTGIGFIGLLTIAFIVLKLTHHIDWSWWWIISPVWISICLFILLAIFVFAVSKKS